jgi:hypothetical protein
MTKFIIFIKQTLRLKGLLDKLKFQFRGGRRNDLINLLVIINMYIDLYNLI